MKKTSMTFLLTCLLSGCYSWSHDLYAHPTKPDSEFSKDHAACYPKDKALAPQFPIDHHGSRRVAILATCLAAKGWVRL
jgi:hypothetical protein